MIFIFPGHVLGTPLRTSVELPTILDLVIISYRFYSSRENMAFKGNIGRLGCESAEGG